MVARLAAPALVALGCGAAAGEGEAAAALEIGIPDGDAFLLLDDGDVVPLRFNTNGGIDMITLDLRADSIDPRAPEVEVTVTVEGMVLGGDLTTRAPWDMEPDGDAYVLRDVNVGFVSRSCCHNCRQGLIEARLRDAKGRLFEGLVDAVLAVGACPAPEVCCQSADQCPDPALAMVCE